MRGLWSQFGPNVVLTAVLVAAALISALVVAYRQRRRGRPVLRPVARLLAWCSVGVIVAATVGFRGIGVTDGDWVLGLGDGGLRWWATDLRAFPSTVRSILLVGNVALYVPLGFFGGVEGGTA